MQKRIEAKLEKVDAEISAKQQELEQIMPRYEELQKQEENCNQRYYPGLYVSV